MPIKNFITISVLFLTFVSTNLLVKDPCKGMFGEEDEKEQGKLELTIPKSQKEWEEQKITGKNNTSHSKPPIQQDSSSFGVLPDDTLLYIFSLLKVEDLGRISQVSSRWYEVFGISRLWENVGLENYRDYFTVVDLEKKPKEKVIHHYLSIRQNVLDALEGAGVRKDFEKKYDLSSFIPYFKTYLPRAVKNGDEGFSSEKYGKFDIPQDIETKKEIEKFCRERDNFIKLAESETTKTFISNPYSTYYGGKHYNPFGQGGSIVAPAPNRTHLESAKQINEKLIELGDEDAVHRKKKELTKGSSEFMRLNFLYLGGWSKEWDIFVENFVDKFCHKGYLFAFEWKIEFLLEKNENGVGFIESMLQNNNPIIRNMGHYVRVFGLKHGKLGYEKDHDKAVSYIRLYNVPY